jgi:hypothetical protein
MNRHTFTQGACSPCPGHPPACQVHSPIACLPSFENHFEHPSPLPHFCDALFFIIATESLPNTTFRYLYFARLCCWHDLSSVSPRHIRHHCTHPPHPPTLSHPTPASIAWDTATLKHAALWGTTTAAQTYVKHYPAAWGSQQGRCHCCVHVMSMRCRGCGLKLGAALMRGRALRRRQRAAMWPGLWGSPQPPAAQAVHFLVQGAPQRCDQWKLVAVAQPEPRSAPR